MVAGARSQGSVADWKETKVNSSGDLPVEAGELDAPVKQEDESYADYAYRVLCDELIVLDIKLAD